MQITHEKITFLKHPIVCIVDLFQTGASNPLLYSVALFPALLTTLGLIADTYAIFGFSFGEFNRLIWFLTVSVIVYGLINIILIVLLQKASIRLRREQSWYAILHKEIIEKIRDYRAQKENDLVTGQSLINSAEIKKNIEMILSAFNDRFMCIVHRNKVIATIKFVFNDQLYSIRTGEYVLGRSINPEDKKNCPIFDAFSQATKRKRQYIYVKNVDKFELKEAEVFGVKCDYIKKRAAGNYKTFVTMPIRGGVDNRIANNLWFERNTIGTVCFDINQPYGFGDLPEHHLEYMACFVDLISELVFDLILKMNTEHNLKNSQQDNHSKVSNSEKMKIKTVNDLVCSLKNAKKIENETIKNISKQSV